jgi:hypothetical protein
LDQARAPGGELREFGVTGRDRNDAVSLLRNAVRELFEDMLAEQSIAECREIQRADELDQKHVIPNMGVMLKHGVWYPNLPHIQ